MFQYCMNSELQCSLQHLPELLPESTMYPPGLERPAAQLVQNLFASNFDTTPFLQDHGPISHSKLAAQHNPDAPMMPKYPPHREQFV